MRKARITAHQIIAVIRSVESGRTVKDVYREAGISEATRDNWKSDTVAGIRVESQKAPPYLLSAQAEFSP